MPSQAKGDHLVGDALLLFAQLLEWQEQLELLGWWELLELLNW